MTQQDLVIDSELRDEVLDQSSSVFVKRNSDNDQATIAVLLLQCNETRNLGLAGCTLRRPKIDDHDLAVEIR
jgi:hypothetical protein